MQNPPGLEKKPKERQETIGWGGYYHDCQNWPEQSLGQLALEYKLPVLAPLYDFSRQLVKEALLDSLVRTHMAPLKDYHPGTYNHSIRDAEIAVDIGVDKGLGLADLYLLARSALLHDIGKLDIPTEILDKTDGLSPDEKSRMKKHPAYGFEKLKYLSDSSKYPVLLHHTFKKDPYPEFDFPIEGLEHMLMITEILSAADILDALIDTKRNYKKTLPYQNIITTFEKEFTGQKDIADLSVLRLNFTSYPI